MGFDNGTLARKYITELWGKGNLALIDELVDDSIKLSDPITKKTEGKAAVKAHLERMGKELSESSIAIDEITVAGDVVVVREKWSGVHKGDFFGVPAAGKRVTCDAVDWLRFKDGKVVEDYSYFDLYEVFQQLGAAPSPEQFKSAKPEAAAKTARA